MKYRLESDSVGEKQVPFDAYYGVQTLRAHENFNITGYKFPESLIIALAEIKKACAITNLKAGELDETIEKAIVEACDDVIEGKFHDQFILDPIQGGAGTSANMNANEVIANIGLEKLGKEKGDYKFCHPNDHVNMAQSTNDVYPTSLKIALYRTGHILADKLDELDKALSDKAEEFKDVLKLGRTQLEDAVPITLGQEFKAHASAVKRVKRILLKSLEEMQTVNMAATAIGTGINASEYFYHHIAEELSEVTGIELTQADDLVDGTQNIDAFSVVSGALKTCAIALSKMANDIRLLNSGPKSGIGEITIPAKQNGSSIMPGKINPVIPEVLNQACFAVIGNDMTVTMACEGGQMELNAFEPVAFYRIYESMVMLTNAIDTFIVNCVVGIVANVDKCMSNLMNSTGLVTALAPYIGYKKSAEIAKQFLKDGTPIIDGAKEAGLTDEQLKEILDPEKLARQFEKK